MSKETARSAKIGGSHRAAELPATAVAEALAPLADADARSSPQRYTVSLTCPTPLAHNPATFDATCEADAVRQFMALNGISGSDHEFRAVPADS